MNFNNGLLKMKILLSDIPDEGLDLELEEAFGTGTFKLLSPARSRLRIDKVGPDVVVSGNITTIAELQCSRCLKSFSREIDVDVNVEYRPVEELKTDERHEIKEDELDLGFYKGNEIDIQEAIAEQIILSFPMKPLCSESCEGLCPKCGADLNLAPCACDVKDANPQFEALKKLLNNRKE